MKKFAKARRWLELLIRDPILAFLVGVIFLSLAIFVVSAQWEEGFVNRRRVAKVSRLYGWGTTVLVSLTRWRDLSPTCRESHTLDPISREEQRGNQVVR